MRWSVILILGSLLAALSAWSLQSAWPVFGQGSISVQEHASKIKREFTAKHQPIRRLSLSKLVNAKASVELTGIAASLAHTSASEAILKG